MIMPTDWYTHLILWAVASIPLWLAAWLWIRIGMENDYQHGGNTMNICANGIWILYGQWVQACFWWDPRWWGLHRWPGDVQVGPFQVVW